VNDYTFVVENVHKPCVAMDKLSLRLQSPHLDMKECECSPTELEHYRKIFSDLTGYPPEDQKNNK
jgi:hypothetical protein